MGEGAVEGVFDVFLGFFAGGGGGVGDDGGTLAGGEHRGGVERLHGFLLVVEGGLVVKCFEGFFAFLHEDVGFEEFEVVEAGGVHLEGEAFWIGF